MEISAAAPSWVWSVSRPRVGASGSDGVRGRSSRVRSPQTDFEMAIGHDGVHPPVLKHGPRSLTSMRVIYWKGIRRTEREARMSA